MACRRVQGRAHVSEEVPIRSHNGRLRCGEVPTKGTEQMPVAALVAEGAFRPGQPQWIKEQAPPLFWGTTHTSLSSASPLKEGKEPRLGWGEGGRRKCSAG